MTLNYCPNCGHEVRDGASFCSECGTTLGEEVPEGTAESVAGASTAAEASGSGTADHRSTGRLAALLTLVGTAVMAVDGISNTGIVVASFRPLKAIIAWVPVATAVVSLPMVYGHWFRRLWAWRVTQLAYGVYGVTILLSFVYAGPAPNPTGTATIGLVITLALFVVLRTNEAAYRS